MMKKLLFILIATTVTFLSFNCNGGSDGDNKPPVDTIDAKKVLPVVDTVKLKPNN